MRTTCRVPPPAASKHGLRRIDPFGKYLICFRSAN
jgi:hypothetical protein